MKNEIKSRYSGEVLFAHEQENNTIRITLELAVKARANLTEANLIEANLRGANLTEANLTEANLLCVGDMRRIFTIQLDTWHIGFTKDTLQIGCQRHLIEKWKTFDDEIINKMDDKALEWWSKWKDHIFKTIELCFGEER